MIVKVQKISLMPLALIFCLLHAVVGVVLGAVVSLGALTNSGEGGIWDLGVWAILVLPLINAALGFVTGLFLAGTYNLIVRILGRGIEVETEEIS